MAAACLQPIAAGPEALEADPQQNVDVLCQRFSALFAQLHREESAFRAATLDNERLERQLAELRQEELRESEQQWAAKVDERLGAEVAELRRQAQLAEQRAALAGGEVGALAAAAEAYARQAARLQERCDEEVVREREASNALQRNGEHLRELFRQRRELESELTVAEVGRFRLSEELQAAESDAWQTGEEVSSLQEHAQAQKVKTEVAATELMAKREEVATLDERLHKARVELEALVERLEQERTEGRSAEERLGAQLKAQKVAEEDLKALTRHLDAKRREGLDLYSAVRARISEADGFRQRLQRARNSEKAEQQVAKAAAARLARARDELAGAARARAEAEAELRAHRERTHELEEKCAAQRAWEEEQRHKRGASSAALERLREEFRGLGADRTRLQREVDEVVRERTRLEVELQVATPALQEVKRRMSALEARLAHRVRELGAESDKLRHCRRDAAAAKAELHTLERRTDLLGARLREYRALEASRGRPSPQKPQRQALMPSQPSPRQQPHPPHQQLQQPQWQQQSALPPEPSFNASSTWLQEPMAFDSSRIESHSVSTFVESTGVGPGYSLRHAPAQFSADPLSRSSSGWPRDPPWPMEAPSGASSRGLQAAPSGEDGDSAARRCRRAPSPAALTGGVSSSCGVTGGPGGRLRGPMNRSQSVPRAVGSCAASPGPQQPTTEDAVRFLCDFVAREEERLWHGSSALRPTGSTDRLAGASTRR